MHNIYMFSFHINISIQVVISMYDMVLWSVQMNRSLCMSKYIWHYVSEKQMLEYVCNVVYRVTAKICLSRYDVSKWNAKIMLVSISKRNVQHSLS